MLSATSSPSFVFITTFIISQWFLLTSNSFVIPFGNGGRCFFLSKSSSSSSRSTCFSSHSNFQQRKRRISLLGNRRSQKRLSSLTLLRSSNDGSTSNDDVNSDVEDEEDALLDEETILRFQGVGRLYEQTISTSSSTTKTKTKTPPSLTYTQILTKLQKSTIAIIGIGGVGSWIAESICRSGIHNIILVDLDDVCISNTNRQIHATTSNIGKMKINVMKERLLDINPNVNVTCIHEFITQDNVFDIVETFRSDDNDNTKVDVIIDAIDGNTEKAALIAACCVKNIPIITCGGAAGRIDPTQIVCQDLSTSVDCKLLFWTKKKLRNEYRLFPNNDDDTGVTTSAADAAAWKTNKKKKNKMKKWRIPAIYSLETQKKLDNDNSNDNDSSSSSFRKCDGGLGTASFVTGTYGMIAASQAIQMIVNNDFPKPRVIKSSVEYWNQVHEEKKKEKERQQQDDNDDDDGSDTQNDILQGIFADLN